MPAGCCDVVVVAVAAVVAVAVVVVVAVGRQRFGQSTLFGQQSDCFVFGHRRKRGEKNGQP